MDEEGLQVSLVPAGPLLHPVHEVAVGLLERDRFEHLDLVAARGTSGSRGRQSSVTLYGSHPPSVRSATRRKWFDVPPSGIGASNDDQAGQEEGEPHGVLDGEPLGDDVLRRVAVRQLRLQAAHLGTEPAAAPRPPDAAGGCRARPRRRRPRRGPPGPASGRSSAPWAWCEARPEAPATSRNCHGASAVRSASMVSSSSSSTRRSTSRRSAGYSS